MPGVDDFKLLNMSEMNSSSPEIKVIMLTSVCQRTIQSQYKKKIISAYIQKPMKQSKLLDTILEVLWSDINNKNHTPVEQSHLLKKNQRSLKILLAEDNLVNQKITCSYPDYQSSWLRPNGLR